MIIIKFNRSSTTNGRDRLIQQNLIEDARYDYAQTGIYNTSNIRK